MKKGLEMNFKQSKFVTLEDDVLKETIGGVNPLVLVYLSMLGAAYSTGYNHGKDLARRR
ncbi:hypothetical protein [Pseudolactococcus carnosus]|uniref:hypothetical protein n=1 Tax=Pseudolactococcus carnosus TaxID=2749961 RepID=UPI001FB9D539|nr:hypothetical protein [Lactococcus carnosus]MCJ1979615.1 hypothetical protein [Lactococcus carnosus]